MPPCIKLNKLTKVYGTTVAVDGLSLEVQAGEVFGLLGPNGAGKSTTLYMLTGLVRPTSGTVAVFNRDLRKHFLAIVPRIGAFIERPAFYRHLSARKNLLLLAKLAQREVTIDRILDLVGLLEVGDQPVGAFSVGMRQRLGLAQALLTEPELLLLDEPTAGLDVEAAAETLELLRHLAREARVTIVFSTHQLHEAEQLCDRVAILNHGKLVACEETDQLVSYDESLVEVLVDAPEAAAKRLRDMPWVVEAVVKGTSVTVRLNGTGTHQLIAFLVSSGYRLSGVMPRRRTLREYFLRTLNP